MLGIIKHFAFLLICLWQWSEDLTQGVVHAGLHPTLSAIS